jgi:hypothetical protein
MEPQRIPVQKGTYFGGAGRFGRQGDCGRSTSRRPPGPKYDKKDDENCEPSLKEIVKNCENESKQMKGEFDTMKTPMVEILNFIKTKNVNWVDPEDVDEDDEVIRCEKVLFLEDSSKIEKMTLDTACPTSMTNRYSLNHYLEANNMLNEDLDVKKLSKKFRFGPSRMYESKELVTLAVTIQMEENGKMYKKIVMKVYVIDCANLPLLCGKNKLDEWNVEMRMRDGQLNFIDDKLTAFCIKDKDHFILPLYQLKNWNTDKTVYMINEDNDICTFEKIKKIHEATNHNGVRPLLHAFRNAGRLTDEVRRNIENVVTTCKICQKYGKSQGTPKVSLTEVSDFNQVVTMDLKQFGKRQVLWIIAVSQDSCKE